MSIASASAVVFLTLTAAVVVFQLALAVGAPWGAYAMGGAFPGKYPPLMRLAAAAQAILLVFIALVVLSRAGLAFTRWAGPSAWLIWAVVVFSGAGLVLNLMTPSAGERRIWAPVTGVMLICSLIVAFTAGE